MGSFLARMSGQGRRMVSPCEPSVNALPWAAMRAIPIVITSLLAFACSDPEIREPLELAEDELIALAEGIHERVLTLDTHCDISLTNFTKEKNYSQSLKSQVDLPKMREGGLDVAWFIVYTGQEELTDEAFAKAYDIAMSKFQAIHDLCDEFAPDEIELATTSEEARRIHAAGKLVAMIGIENAYPVGLDLANIEKFAKLGGRYMSLAHQGHSQFSDSNTGETEGEWLHGGLSELGREAIAEMNKWGIMVDVSHPSRDAVMEMIELTQAPLVASHSSARAMNDVSRNLDDEQLKLIAQGGGVVQTVAFRSYLATTKNAAFRDASKMIEKGIAKERGFAELTNDQMRQLDDAELMEYIEARNDIRAEASKRLTESDPGDVDVSDFVDHIDYMVDLIGIDHVGISSDFDGGGGVEGWDDASESFNVTLELVRRGYTEPMIDKLWSGNLLRVLDETQAVAARLQAAK